VLKEQDGVVTVRMQQQGDADFVVETKDNRTGSPEPLDDKAKDIKKALDDKAKDIKKNINKMLRACESRNESAFEKDNKYLALVRFAETKTEVCHKLAL
jgi:actin-like ATPase involved in cell morphogenesis